MKIPVDELNIIVRHDGLVLAKHPRGAVLEQLITPGMVKAVLCVLETEWRAERIQRGSVQGGRVVHPITRPPDHPISRW